MKTHQCPICGSKRTFLDIIPQGYQYICTQCGLCALRQFTPQEAAEAWNELVFKFPPVMRVWPGDKVKLFGERRARRIIGKNAGRGVLYLETVSGPPDPVRQDDVILWPWELNRKKVKNRK